MLKNTCLDPIYKMHKQGTPQNQNHKEKKKTCKETCKLRDLIDITINHKV